MSGLRSTPAEARPLRYAIDPPDHCDLCRDRIGLAFVDGRTVVGSWAYMCPPCFDGLGVGLGEGKGQVFHKQSNGRFLNLCS